MGNTSQWEPMEWSSYVIRLAGLTLLIKLNADPYKS